MKNIALVLASGTGERSGLNQPKQFFQVCGKTLLEHSVEAFDRHAQINGIVVVSHPDFLERTQNLVAHYGKVLKVISGSATRQESSYNGVFAIDDAENVLIHDAVRAFVSDEIISACIDGLKSHDAVCTAVETSDTILEVDTNGRIVSVPQRKNLRCAQTPQCFKLDLIKHAHTFARQNGLSVTDDCGLVLASKLAEIYVIAGSSDNLKITYPGDLEFVRWNYEKKT
ncbi:MAG: 2-C-methyl-D-erythritol 4-phosphate cytidylyltransferase [Fusobacterium sp.]|nr:2-C-methyl-D-erythritol 4-phosphate cytidylyltransferase [Fusobacterium sp.]